jgi:cyclophilin family peptidyl-prolyl cis-trans isomerase
MSRNSDDRPHWFAAGGNGKNSPRGGVKRSLRFEDLEQRRLLSTVGLNSISTVTLPAGTSVLVALNGSDSGNAVKFGVTTSDPTKVAPILMPSTNKSVTFNVNGSGIVGSMTFQLFDNLTPTTTNHIETLVNDGFYNGDYIYRAQSGFVVQGGNDPPQINGGAAVNTLPSGVPSTIDEEFNPDLNYTTGGDLAMARTSSANSSSTEFFITEAAAQNPLDYAYTLYGFQTLNQAITVNGQATTVLQAIEAQPTESSSGFSYLTTPIKITSASITTDTQNGVLMLRAPAGITGSYTVNVTAYDAAGDTPTTRSFTVNVVAPTVTGNTANPWASKTPAAPTQVVFQPQAGQGSTYTADNNSSASTKLQFQVSGTTAGYTVTIYANGVPIGTGTSSGGTITVTTDGSTKLFDGSYTITATQTDPNVTVADSGDGGTNETANVDSLMSPGIALQVGLKVTSTPATTATVGQTYTYTVQTDAPSGDTVTVTPGSLPSGMTYTAATQTFTWTPAGNQQNTVSAFSATVSDSLGHTATIGPVSISIGLAIAIPTNASLGGNVTVSFSGSQYEVYDNIGKAVLTTLAFKSTDIITIDCPAGQANSVSIVLPSSTSAPVPQEVLVQGLSGSTNNQVTVVGTNGTNTVTVAGSTVTANGLKTMISTVQKLTLNGGSGNNDDVLNSSAVPLSIVETGGSNTLDFSNDTAGVTVNLGLNKGQAQSIAPWGTTLSISGAVNKLIGSAYADVLVGGPAATTEIVGGTGNDTITGGSGNNILMGGGGADTITGGPGKNLIIGGSGNSKLYAKGTEDIIFAGTTNIDSNDQALLNLLNQGSRVTYGYSARRLLASSASNTAIRSAPAVTFQDVGAHDTIFGSSVNDWFVLGKYGTQSP